jgi:Family of unknown function (DUF5677)
METQPTLPSLQELLREFAQRHHLRFTDLVSREKIAIQSTSVANILVNQGYTHLDTGGIADPAVGLLLNMLHRNCEHVDAAIVAFVSGCGSSAEVIARAAVEASVNILYILGGERVSRLLAYFNHYLEGVHQQVGKWRAQVNDLSPDESEIHHIAIAQKLAANTILRRVIDALGVASDERWPTSINERFKLIGDSLGYRTFYARMSSETHADAEETLRYFVGRLQDNEALLNAMALETVWTTRFYIYYAVSYFLQASLAYARSYSLQAADGPLEKELANVRRELLEIGAHVGARI